MRRSVGDLARKGRDAFLRGDGEASQRAFKAALAVEETGELLEGLGRALYIRSDYRGSLEYHERAFGAYRREGNRLAAARVGRMLAWIHQNLLGDFAVSNGWLSRTCRLLEEAGQDSAERGWVEVIRAPSERDPKRREERYRTALALATRFGDRDLEIETLGWIALEPLLQGRIEEGMTLLDEGLAAVCAGEVEDLYVMEGMFCGMFTACERVHDVARAEQWIRAADEIVKRRSMVAVGAFCRAHYGGILTDAGRWSEAERELVAAARVFEDSYAWQRADPIVRLADLRVRQGRLDEAAELLVGLDQHPRAARPIAGLRAARGELALAREVLERALVTSDLADDLSPVLTLLVEVEIAQGALDDAEKTAARLTALAEDLGVDYVRGCAAFARGKLCLAAGRGDARGFLLAALAAFSRARTPMELGRARLELARAVAPDRPEVAAEEARAALRAFEQLEARGQAEAARTLLRSLESGAPRTGSADLPQRLTNREAEVLRLVATGRRNREIAAELVISEHTVARHVQNIFTKLDVSSRAAATAFAHEHRLV